jgi:hypothetical protein
MENKWGPSMYGPEFDNAIWAIVEKIKRGEYDTNLDMIFESYPNAMPGSGPIHEALFRRKIQLRRKES